MASTGTTATDPTAASTTASSSTATSTTSTGSPLSELTLTFPPGSIDADEGDDLFVLGVDGDLALHPDALNTGVGTGGSIRLVDHPDPRVPVTEGPGPNIIEDVAGVINGSVVYGECCEPISGSVYAVTQPEGEETPIVDGYSPNLSPYGGRLAVANDFLLTVVATTTRSGLGLQLNEGDQSPGAYRNVRDVQWLSNDEVAMLFWTEGVGYQVAVYEATTLVEVQSGALGIERDVGSDESVRFAGLGPDGALAVAVRRADATLIRFFDPTDLDERSELGRSLPGGVTAVELADDGVGLLWVDDETVFFLGAGAFEATPLATDALAAWFVQTA